MSAQRQPPEPSRRSQPRELYRRPRLERLGDLRGLTLGTSPDVFDSGSGFPDLTLPP